MKFCNEISLTWPSPVINPEQRADSSAILLPSLFAVTAIALADTKQHLLCIGDAASTNTSRIKEVGRWRLGDRVICEKKGSLLCVLIQNTDLLKLPALLILLIFTLKMNSQHFTNC